MVSSAIRILADRLSAAGVSPESSLAQAAIARGKRWIEHADTIERVDRNGSPSQRLHREQAAAELDCLAGSNDPAAWSRLADGWAALGYAYDEAYTRFRQADAVLAGTSGRTARARHDATSSLQTASTITQRLAASPLAHRIDDLAVRARLPIQPMKDRPPKPTRFDAHAVPGLTQREQSVLALLAEGYSNGQIAQALFITTKTASVHVSNILRRLNVTNRVEAAAKAQRSPQR
jgi:DNA-binding CsgD family transcriptional regulator